MVVIKWIVIVFLVGAIALLVAGQLGLLKGDVPSNLGVKEGKLKAPSKTPNSATSQADLWPDHPQREYARVAPLPLRGDAAATLAKLQAIVKAMPGAVVVKAEGDYLYAQFTTSLLKFTDDVEFWSDPVANVIQVRSSSRLGRKDFGVNRARVEAIRTALAGA